jgi:hypothetical protein
MIGERIGGAPRTRTELNLLAREIRGPCACPDWACLWGQTLQLRVHGAMARKKGLTPRMTGAWGRFRATSPRLQRGAFNQISFPGEFTIGAADGNRTHVCAWATRGSAIELRTLVHRAGLEPAEPEGTWATTRPRCRLSICACWLNRAGDLAIARALVGGRLTVLTPHLAVPTRFQDGVPATPRNLPCYAESMPKSLDVSARFERATPASGWRYSDPLSYDTKLGRAARPSRGSRSSSRADSRVGTHVWQPAVR